MTREPKGEIFMDGNVTGGNKESIEQRKSGKVAATVAMEADASLQQRIVDAGIGRFHMIASFWSTTLENIKSHVSEDGERSKVSSFLNFDNGKVIASEQFKLPLFSNPAIVKLLNKVKKKDKVERTEKTTDEK